MTKCSKFDFIKKILSFAGSKKGPPVSRTEISRIRDANARIAEIVYPKIEQLRASGVKGDAFRDGAKEISCLAKPIMDRSAKSITENIERLGRKHPVEDGKPGNGDAYRQRYAAIQRFGGRMATKNPGPVLDSVLGNLHGSADASAFESGWKYHVPNWYDFLDPKVLSERKKVNDAILWN